MKRIGPASVAMAAAVGILATGCSSSAPNEVPDQWISSTYEYELGDYVDPSDAPRKVADEIDGHTAAADRLSDDGMVFLRYEDDMVAISPRTSGSGSVIDIDDYDDGYDRWGSHVRSKWPAPGSGSFRGGGPGLGK
ncbi:DUF4247 domain-containing protein [Streptomyces sp. DSM 42041]|uniref:DUF4247 domain-containing protein n=1 Tax=Streptomyces hazeniae TaxID=3075538 RepID=A0ABU2NTM2_9ACTN|nr:DUF4247 domain-containing protein [Streptomyces sp. DSM 42041]MDT0380325.1 DUF4247 domain-containing protein [Streptomyces sp. DSM 42041]